MRPKALFSQKCSANNHVDHGIVYCHEPFYFFLKNGIAVTNLHPINWQSFTSQEFWRLCPDFSIDPHLSNRNGMVLDILFYCPASYEYECGHSWANHQTGNTDGSEIELPWFRIPLQLLL